MNRNFFLFFFIFAFNRYYLVPSSSATPIVGGTPDEHHIFRHHVSLHRTVRGLPDTYEYFCGGSIVSEKHVLTVAFCFLGTRGREFVNLIERRPKIIAGTNLRDGPGIERFIVRVFIPNVYISGMNRNGDISVVELNSNLDVLPNISIMLIIPMYNLDPEHDADQNAVFSGFGATRMYGNVLIMSEINHYLAVFVRSRSHCPIDNFFICANSYATRVETACHGDLGSGLIVRGMIVGVLNYAPVLCNTNERPIIFTRIKTFRDFIDRAMDPRGNHLDMHVLYGRGVGSSSGSGHTSPTRSPSPTRTTQRITHQG